MWQFRASVRQLVTLALKGKHGRGLPRCEAEPLPPMPLRHGDFEQRTYFAAGAGAAGLAGAFEEAEAAAVLFTVVAGLAVFLCFLTIFLPLSAELLVAAGAGVVAGVCAKPATAKAREVAMTNVMFFILVFLSVERLILSASNN